MTINNLKSKSRSQSLDIGGKLFIKGKLQFRFIRKWVIQYNENILKLKRRYPVIFTKFKSKIAIAMHKKMRIRRLKYFKYLLRNNYIFQSKFLNISNFKYKITKLRRNEFKFKFDILDYDLDLEFIKYYSLFKANSFFKYRIRYDSFPRKFSLSKKLFYKKQRFKSYLNLKDYQLKNYIKNLKKKKFYLFDFFYFLEYRLDTILYRVFFFQNYKVVRQFIRNYGVYVNGKLVKNYNYIARIGDLIQLSKNLASLKMLMYLMNQFFLVPFPKYFEVNYNILSLVVKSFFLFKYNTSTKNMSNWTKPVSKNLYDFSRKSSSFYGVDKPNSYYNYLINVKKKKYLVYKKNNPARIVYGNDQLYFPFKFKMEDLNAIFQYY